MNYDESKPLFNYIDEWPEMAVLREFKISGVRCVSVKNLDGKLLGFYIGTDEDWTEGIITKKDLMPIDRLKRSVNQNCE